LLHDTNVRERKFGVFHLWTKLQSRWPSFEFIHGHGLGIVGVGADLTGPLPRLFQTNGRAKVASAIRSMYSSLGKSLELRMEKERELLELERAMARQGSEIGRLKRDLVESEAGIRHLERKIESLQTSRCWKITAPLRWIDHLFSWRARFWSSLKDETMIGVNRDCRPNSLFDSSIRNGSSHNFLTNKKLDDGAHCDVTKVNEASPFASPIPPEAKSGKALPAHSQRR
jgi:hypothetical protein